MNKCDTYEIDPSTKPKNIIGIAKSVICALLIPIIIAIITIITIIVFFS